MKASTYVPIIKALCRQAGIPEPASEVRFANPRHWRLDFAWTRPEHRVALEVQGGIWVDGRHSRGSGLLKEYEKMNAAAARGWRICYCTPDTIPTGIKAVSACLNVMYLPETVQVKGTDYFPGLVDVSAYPALRKFCVPVAIAPLEEP